MQFICDSLHDTLWIVIHFATHQQRELCMKKLAWDILPQRIFQMTDFPNFANIANLHIEYYKWSFQFIKCKIKDYSNKIVN